MFIDNKSIIRNKTLKALQAQKATVYQQIINFSNSLILLENRQFYIPIIILLI